MGFHHRRRSSSIFLGEATFRRASVGVNLTSRRRLSLTGGLFSSHHKDNEVYARFYRAASPSPPALHIGNVARHNLCIANDKTYSRLAARLERMRSHRDAVDAQIDEHGRSSGLKPVLKHLKESVDKLESTLEGMMEDILYENSSGNGGSVFKAGGKWVREI